MEKKDKKVIIKFGKNKTSNGIEILKGQLEPELKSRYTAKELLDMDVTQIPMLWGSLLQSFGLAILTGSSDCGKSTLLRQLSIAICRGDKTFLDLNLKPVHKKVCVVSTEDDEYGVAYILKKQIEKDYDEDYVNRLEFIFNSRDYLADMDTILTETPCDMIVLDSWGDILLANPNDFTAVRGALMPWRELSRKHKCLVLIIHHTIKNSENFAPDKNKLNGSQGMEAKCRSLLELRLGTSPSDRILSVLKANYLSEEEKAISLVLSIDGETLLFENTGLEVERNSINSVKKNRFEEQLWLSRMLTLKTSQPKISSEEAINLLTKKYPNEDIPSKGWFFGVFKKFKIQPFK